MLEKLRRAETPAALFGKSPSEPMRRLFTALIVVGAISHGWCAPDLDAILRDAIAASRTNSSAALKLCDKAVSDFPTNAQPLVVRAGLLDRNGRHEDALKDLTAALRIDLRAPQIWEARGEVNFRMGNFKESVADFDRVLALAPDRAPYHWQRGISLYYAQRYADARKQFELHKTVNPNDVENAAWHFLCAARERGVTNARNSMLAVGPDARVPMLEIDAFYRGTGSVEKVLSAASRPATVAQQRDAFFYAHLYLGLYFDVTGDRTLAAEHIGKAAKEFSAEHYMGDVARVQRSLLR